MWLDKLLYYSDRQTKIGFGYLGKGVRIVITCGIRIPRNGIRSMAGGVV